MHGLPERHRGEAVPDAPRASCQTSATLPVGRGKRLLGAARPAPLESLRRRSQSLAEAITGCEQLSFTPSLSLAPETTQAGAPSGYTIDLHVPQNEDPRRWPRPTCATRS